MGTNRPIEGINPLKPAHPYTYKDYLQWPPEERWEIIHGVAYAMSPSPNRKHQGVLRELSRQIGVFLLGKPCKLFMAPFDVLLGEPGESVEETSTIVQPDLLVLCDSSKLTDESNATITAVVFRTSAIPSAACPVSKAIPQKFPLQWNKMAAGILPPEFRNTIVYRMVLGKKSKR
jgi:hypothetical protein